ncbi:major tail protein [Ureibacillus sp. FSL E2-3493]|uniref:major tail protein n=1 Tax=Ureibacillus sp. FSL E2-3493 TaxID=2921367 RepID=UPI00311A6A27
MAAIGLKNIVVAKITKDDETGTVYETPRKLSPAMNVNITPTVNSANLPGDDQVQETIEELESVTVSFGVNEIDNEDYAYIMGKTVDANNGVTDKSTDEAPYLAFGYEAPLTGGRKRMTWLYKGKFGLPTEELQTKQGSPSFQTPTVEGTFIPRKSDSKWRYRVESNETNQAVIDGWFDAVQEEPTTTPEV